MKIRWLLILALGFLLYSSKGVFAQQACINVCVPVGCALDGYGGGVYYSGGCSCGQYCYNPTRPESNNVATSCGCSPCYCPASPTPFPATPRPSLPPAPTLAPTAPPAQSGGGGGNTNPPNPPSESGGGGGGYVPPPAISGPYCGDGVCSGFENCAVCLFDCGVCPALATHWWQALGGHVFAGLASGNAIVSHVPQSTCTAPTCQPYLLHLDRQQTPNSVGVAMTGGGQLNVAGYNRAAISPPLWTAQETTVTRYRETYSFFYRKTNLGTNPDDDFLGTAQDARKPNLTQPAYFHAGDLTIQSSWQVNVGEVFVIFVEGDLTLSDPTETEQLVMVAEGGFLAFIVSGNIVVQANVGNATLTNTQPNIEGVYIADGTLTIAGVSSGNDKRFIGAGSFVGWETVKLERDLGAANNATTPAEQFIYRPDFVANTPDIMKHPLTIWQESK